MILTPFSTDDTFNKWVQRRLKHTLGQPAPAPPTAHPTQQHPFVVPHGLPTVDPPLQNTQHQMPSNSMWAQFTANLTQGLAAALQPTATALAASAGSIASEIMTSINWQWFADFPTRMSCWAYNKFGQCFRPQNTPKHIGQI
jgi:hypothetical protein